ncbi:MAG: 23S rRNA (uracil(1939)-C(5))-methyltransferase RlmD [Bacteroidetes bacterium]|nr:MAG: 23S rRNA (uracil(1939)-C(5))-methyltransferase RlmD [Bacteroidota bacterium]
MPLALWRKIITAVARRKPVVLKDVLVENYAAEGKSMARVDGKVVFIENAIPGDVVDVFLNKNKTDWAEGYPVAFSTLSSDRITPFCEHFGVCGGCQWQHLPYHKQLAYKQQQVVDQLTRIGGVALPPLQPIIGAQKTTAYRNKLEFTFNTRRYLTRPELDDPMVSGHGNFGGFHARGIFDKIVNINTCHLMAEPVNIIREAIKRITLQLDMPFYDINQHAGWLRGVMYRYCTTGHLMVNVMLAYDAPEATSQLLDGLLAEVPAITSLYYTINGKRNDSLTDLEPVLYHGARYATETLGGFQFNISPTSFFQTNTYQAEQLYEVARQFAELDGSQTVYDLYCGTGSIGIFVSKGAKKLIGVEVVAAAVADAEANAALNGISHASFFAGDVVDVCDDAFFAQHGTPHVIITDPPRAGMHPQLIEKILDMAAPIVVYVSCNPATQARDLRLLAEKYTVSAVQPVDMFPHTHHIENVVQLKLKAEAV